MKSFRKLYVSEEAVRQLNHSEVCRMLYSTETAPEDLIKTLSKYGSCPQYRIVAHQYSSFFDDLNRYPYENAKLLIESYIFFQHYSHHWMLNIVSVISQAQYPIIYLLVHYVSQLGHTSLFPSSMISRMAQTHSDPLAQAYLFFLAEGSISSQQQKWRRLAHKALLFQELLSSASPTSPTYFSLIPKDVSVYVILPYLQYFYLSL